MSELKLRPPEEEEGTPRPTLTKRGGGTSTPRPTLGGRLSAKQVAQIP